MANYSLKAVKAHLDAWYGAPVAVSTEGIVQVEGELSARVSPLTAEQHDEVRLGLLREIIQGDAFENQYVANKLAYFAETLAVQRRLDAIHQKCSMDREDTIAVDLKGNVLTCHNTTELAMRAGHVSAMEEVRVSTAWHFSAREGCLKCPVVHLCQGSCMFLTGEDWKRSCRNNLTLMSAVLSGAVFHLTGYAVTDIEPLTV